MDKLHLYFDTQLNGYCVQLPGTDGVAYTLGIIADWDDKNEREWGFKRIAHQDGEWEEILDGEQLAGRINDVFDHEGEAIAELWTNAQTHYRLGSKRELELFAKAARRFLAFAELGLSIPVSHGAQFKNPRPQMSAEDEAALKALREAEFSEQP